MLAPQTFASQQERRARIGDVDFWWPYLSPILDRHGLIDARHEPIAGHNATYPTFLYGDVVVKLFGNTPRWREGHAAGAAQRLIATDPEIAAPRLLDEGQVCDDPDASWPYLITTRIDGVPLWRAELSPSRSARSPPRWTADPSGARAHPAGVASDAEWPPWTWPPPLEEARCRPTSSSRSTSTSPGFGRSIGSSSTATWSPTTPTSRTAASVGIIDWGDATVADRHYEIIQVYRDLFHCDKALLRVFLEAADWPMSDDFPYWR